MESNCLKLYASHVITCLTVWHSAPFSGKKMDREIWKYVQIRKETDGDYLLQHFVFFVQVEFRSQRATALLMLLTWLLKSLSSGHFYPPFLVYEEGSSQFKRWTLMCADLQANELCVVCAQSHSNLIERHWLLSYRPARPEHMLSIHNQFWH